MFLVGGEFVDLDAHGFELELGDLAVDGFGDRVDLWLSSEACLIKYSTERAWLAKLMSMTEAGWPSAAARLMRRPSPRR